MYSKKKFHDFSIDVTTQYEKSFNHFKHKFHHKQLSCLVGHSVDKRILILKKLNLIFLFQVWSMAGLILLILDLTKKQRGNSIINNNNVFLHFKFI